MNNISRKSLDWHPYKAAGIPGLSYNDMFIKMLTWTLLHCPNSGPHFTPYRTYTTVAFLYREKIYAQTVLLYSKIFYSILARHTWPCNNYPSIVETLCATQHNFWPSWNKFYILTLCGSNPMRHQYYIYVLQ